MRKPFTEERKRKISLSKLGKKRPLFSKEWIENIRRANNGFKKGNTIWLGRKHKEESKELMRGDNNPSHRPEVLAKLRGKNHYNWKGGVSKMQGYTTMKGRRRRVRKKNALGFHSLGNWETLKAQYNWTCPCCGRKEPEIKLTEDHIIPLIKGGSDNIENIQPLCINCNSKKSTKIIQYENKI